MLILMGGDKINPDLEITPTSPQPVPLPGVEDYWLKSASELDHIWRPYCFRVAGNSKYIAAIETMGTIRRGFEIP